MKKVIFLIVVVLTLLSIFSCSTWEKYRVSVPLPDGTSVETAKNIVKFIWNDDFAIKITERFPNFNPQTNRSTQSLALKWIKFIPADKDEEPKIYLHIEIKYEPTLNNAEQIINFSKLLVETKVSEYFSQKPESFNNKMVTDVKG